MREDAKSSARVHHGGARRINPAGGKPNNDRLCFMVWSNVGTARVGECSRGTRSSVTLRCNDVVLLASALLDDRVTFAEACYSVNSVEQVALCYLRLSLATFNTADIVCSCPGASWTALPMMLLASTHRKCFHSPSPKSRSPLAPSCQGFQTTV